KRNRLFRQGSDGRFEDVTEEAGVGDTGYGMGVAVGDIDNDGLVDLYVTNYGPDVLYKNEGNGRFRNVTAEWGIGGDFWSASATFCDYDADGTLDLYVTHYVSYDPDKGCTHADGSIDYCSPQVFPGTSDVLYRNDRGRGFVDVSAEAGLRSVRSPGLGVICADLSGDGKLDFYVANDGEANQFWVNQGDGTFTDDALLLGVALGGDGQPEAGMGITVGDVDSDGDLDLFVTHIINQTNTLYLNQGALGYDDGTMKSGLAAPSLAMTGFGTGFLDFDHDGDLDLAVVNGRVQRHPPLGAARMSAYWNAYAEPNQLLENRGRGDFVDVSADAGDFGTPVEISRGLALGDVDEDGDLDLLVMNTAAKARLYRNDTVKKGDWLLVRAIEKESKRDAHGARVTVTAGGKSTVRIATPAYSYLSSNDPRVHFGIPRGASVERIEIVWPGGIKERFGGVPTNQVVVLERGSGIE
ncbi:MAG TPA: CRTAC1 family protein, partial [Vicinamibacteria bacterium]|nr:CRTAC1 family protein [Vicinamibacteria bacterium]